eukprot:2614997-Prymnesium_polylepis.1
MTPRWRRCERAITTNGAVGGSALPCAHTPHTTHRRAHRPPQPTRALSVLATESDRGQPELQGSRPLSCVLDYGVRLPLHD